MCVETQPNEQTQTDFAANTDTTAARKVFLKDADKKDVSEIMRFLFLHRWLGSFFGGSED